MSPTQIQGVVNRFAREFAAQHDMPEVAHPAWDNVKNADDALETPEMEVVPKGQMSALVNAMYVKMTARYGSYIVVDVRMGYAHPGGGSNGHTSSYRILAEQDFLNPERTRYCGFIREEQSHFLGAQNRRIMQENADKAKA